MSNWQSEVRLGAILTLLACVAAGCTGPINVKPADPKKSSEVSEERTRRRNDLSRDTQQLLRLYNLEERVERRPTAVVAVLSGLEHSEYRLQALVAQAEVAYRTASELPDRLSDEAAGWYLLAAARAYEFMFEGDRTAMERAVDPRFHRARRIYNISVGAYLTHLESQTGGIKSHEQPSRLELYQVDIEVTPQCLDPDRYDRILFARELEIRGLRNRYRRNGIGAPLVAFRLNTRTEPQDRFFPPPGYVKPATALLQFGPRVPNVVGMARQVKLSFYDPREVEGVEIGALEVPLQADFTTPWAYLASLSELPSLARKALLHPEDYDDAQGLFLMEPYDPDRTPVLLVHGLRSSPLAWAELTNDLLGDPVLRQRYQIWTYLYPTGMPYLYAGMVMRAKLEAFRVEFDPEGDDPAMQSMVIVAHSMGGLLTRSLVCDSGMVLWDGAFTIPPDEARGSPQDVEWVEDMFIFEPRPYIDRVVFIAVPHRGSTAAAGALGRVGSSMVELPGYFTERVARLVADNPEATTAEMRAVLEKGAPNSIRALRPSYPVLQALGTLPIDPDVSYHSIMGNRGKDPSDPISDGWVTYESAHLDGAESELIVPSGHAAYSHPATIAEIKRILYLHLETSPPQ